MSIFRSLKKIIRKICPRGFYDFLSRKFNAVKYKSLIRGTFEHYNKVEQRIRERGDKPLRFASYVVYDSSFGAYGLMDLMLAEPAKYMPKIVVCPDIFRGEKHLKEQYKKTKNFFINKYGSKYVIDGYDELKEEFLDVSDQFDVIYCANPYDVMVNKVHGVSYLSKKNVLPIYISYCFQPDKSVFAVMSRLEISLFWQVFTDTVYTLNEYKKYELINGQNVKLTGYAKMDSLFNCVRKEKKRKTIIIAPHHTIANSELPLSNFLKYKDFILTLPHKFPEVDFVFRPHPLLFINMVNEGFWSESDKDKYIEVLDKNKIKYSSGGDYFDLFVNSDALINDCSSFIVEYLFLDMPCCFVNRGNMKKIFSKLGIECLKCYDIAENEKEIEDFISKVINGTVDMNEMQRNKITPNIRVNYPYVSRKILQFITL